MESLGVGGMATVYKARHIHFGEFRALKVIDTELGADQTFVKRFMQEAVVTRRLQHPNIVKVDDIDTAEDGRPFMVMELVGGILLTELLKGGALPVDTVLSIVRQAAAALDAAHHLGMVHRDIKPANLVLQPGPNGGVHLKVLDFGIAKVRESHLDDMRTGYLTLSGEDIVVGTPAYMSPEQAMGKRDEEIDGRADLYSLGTVMYQMLTGRLPLAAVTNLEFLLAQINTPPTPIQEVRPDLPEHVCSLVMSCLAKDRNSRPQTCAEFLAALDVAEWHYRSSQPKVEAPPPNGFFEQAEAGGDSRRYEGVAKLEEVSGSALTLIMPTPTPEPGTEIRPELETELQPVAKKAEPAAPVAPAPESAGVPKAQAQTKPQAKARPQPRPKPKPLTPPPAVKTAAKDSRAVSEGAPLWTRKSTLAWGALALAGVVAVITFAPSHTQLNKGGAVQVQPAGNGKTGDAAEPLPEKPAVAATTPDTKNQDTTDTKAIAKPVAEPLPPGASEAGKQPHAMEASAPPLTKKFAPDTKAQTKQKAQLPVNLPPPPALNIPTATTPSGLGLETAKPPAPAPASEAANGKPVNSAAAGASPAPVTESRKLSAGRAVLFSQGADATFQGVILSREGNEFKLRNDSDGVGVVDITAETRVSSKNSFVVHKNQMNASGLLTGHHISVQGKGTVQGALLADKIIFDDFVSLEGDWAYRPLKESGASRSTQAEFINIKFTKEGHSMTGRMNARFRGTDPAGSSAEVRLELKAVDATMDRFTWTAAGGGQGTLTVRLVDANKMRVDWHAAQPSQEALTAGGATLLRQ